MMKKLLVFFVIAAGSFYSPGFSQIQITSSEVSATMAPGSSWIVSTHDNPLVVMNLGSPGPTAQSWIVPNIQWQQTFTAQNIAPGSTAYASSFPTATHAQFYTGTIQGYPATFYNFYRVESNGFYTLGNVIHVQAGSIDTSVFTYDNDFNFPLPLTYGTTMELSRDSTSHGFGLWTILTRVLSVDAFGTITFPFGTFEALRRKVADETRVYDNGNLINQYATTWFTWFARNGGIFKGDIDTSIATTGNSTLYGAEMIQFNAATSVNENPEGSDPYNYSLSQNYPNPFNPSTTITYSVPEAGQINLKVYDVLGTEITTLVNEYKGAGSYTAIFNATGLPSGVYFYKLTAGNAVMVKKMLLMK